MPCSSLSREKERYEEKERDRERYDYYNHFVFLFTKYIFKLLFNCIYPLSISLFIPGKPSSARFGVSVIHKPTAECNTPGAFDCNTILLYSAYTRDICTEWSHGTQPTNVFWPCPSYYSIALTENKPMSRHFSYLLLKMSTAAWFELNLWFLCIRAHRAVLCSKLESTMVHH